MDDCSLKWSSYGPPCTTKYVTQLPLASAIAELLVSHPSIVVILSKLFNILIHVGHVPNEFGLSYTVPVPKGDSSSRLLTVNDFRGIAISPVISKLPNPQWNNAFAFLQYSRLSYSFVRASKLGVNGPKWNTFASQKLE